jgi:hypothetical protein
VITLTLKKLDDGSNVTFSAARDSCEVDHDGKLLRFFAYIGDSDDTGEPLYIAYVLSDDKSDSKRGQIRVGIDTGMVAWKTRSGFVKGANLESALRKGPSAMKAAALRGARSGFRFGLLYVVIKEIGMHVIRNGSPRQQHYYVSPDGPDFLGPTYLRA